MRLPYPTSRLGVVLFLALFGLGAMAIILLTAPDTYLLRHGVTTQGVITNVEATTCSGGSSAYLFSIQFTDQKGQAHTSTLYSCSNPVSSDTSPGSSFTIVYDPDDPTTIATPDGVTGSVLLDLTFTILWGLLVLIFLALWIRQRIRKASRQDQQE